MRFATGMLRLWGIEIDEMTLGAIARWQEIQSSRCRAPLDAVKRR